VLNGITIFLANLKKKEIRITIANTAQGTSTATSSKFSPASTSKNHSTSVTRVSQDISTSMASGHEKLVKQAYEDVNGKVSTGPPIDLNGLAVQTTGSFDSANL